MFYSVFSARIKHLAAESGAGRKCRKTSHGHVVPAISRIPKHYMTVSKAFLKSKAFSPKQKLVIACLTDHLGEDNHRCWPSYEAIAVETGLSRDQAVSAVKSLVEAGAIIKNPGGGRGRSNRYYLTQSVYPCLENPSILCDRSSCTTQCPWSSEAVAGGTAAPTSANGAESTPFEQNRVEDKQCEMNTVSGLTVWNPHPLGITHK